MIAALAMILMDKRAMDPGPAYVAAWAIAFGAAALLAGLVYLIINGG